MEWVKEHRELQYLRAAAACHPRKRCSSQSRRRRLEYEAFRWRKLEDCRSDPTVQRGGPVQSVNGRTTGTPRESAL
jgi:hypothetical protein